MFTRFLEKKAVTQISLRHNAAPTFGKKGLPESIDAHLSVSVNGRSVSESDIKADDFPGCYSRLNRAYTRAYHAEKKFFAAGGKQRFSNLPSLVGLTVLALSREGMSGTFSRAAKLENILIFLQTGEGREGCIGFRKGLNMNQQYMLKAAAGAALGCAALALGIALKKESKIMNKDIDVSSLKIDLYSDRSVRDFTADVAQKDGRMWLSNVSAEIAAEAAALAVKALRKSGLEDAEMKNAEHFIEVLRKFFPQDRRSGTAIARRVG